MLQSVRVGGRGLQAGTANFERFSTIFSESGTMCHDGAKHRRVGCTALLVLAGWQLQRE